MENKYYLAVDIGASSGRHILAHRQNGKMILEEIYRFPNGMSEHNGHKIWNVDQLYEEILNGMKKCRKIGKIPYSMGIDTWAVDFVLLDEQDHFRPQIAKSYSQLLLALLWPLLDVVTVNVFSPSF